MNKELIEDKFYEIMKDGLGLDMTNSSLKDTPKRVAKMYCNEIFSGLDKENEPIVTVFPNSDGIDCKGMVIMKNITVYSTCEHHFVPFKTKISIGYLPNEKIIGASKLARVSKYFAARPQIQERLGEQIADFLMKKLEPKGIIVSITEGQHLCMMSRGVENDTGLMEYTAVRGVFLENDKGCKDEFMSRVFK